MGYNTDGLTYNTLRGANLARLPEFKNKKGGLAHSTEDGSDWNNGQWIQAILGELGELAEVRILYETGKIGEDEYRSRAAAEFADVGTYLDIAAARGLDQPRPGREITPSHSILYILASLGNYANLRKKFDRGDINLDEFEPVGLKLLATTVRQLSMLIESFTSAEVPGGTAHPSGIDLGAAIIEKFNEVSDRVGSSIYIGMDMDWHKKPTKVGGYFCASCKNAYVKNNGATCEDCQLKNQI